jgi:hypothetical protein
MSVSLVGILLWGKGMTKEVQVVGLVSISLCGLVCSKWVATDRWSLGLSMGSSMVEG